MDNGALPQRDEPDFHAGSYDQGQCAQKGWRSESRIASHVRPELVVTDRSRNGHSLFSWPSSGTVSQAFFEPFGRISAHYFDGNAATLGSVRAILPVRSFAPEAGRVGNVGTESFG